MTAIYLNDLAEKLGVQENTIRSWCRKARSARSLLDSTGQSSAALPATFLPEALWPQTVGGRKKLFWEPSQIAGLERFAGESMQRWCGHPRVPDSDDYSAFADFMENEDLADVPLSHFGLNVRVQRSLERNGISDVHRLSRMSRAELKKLDNFGQKSIEDVWTKVMAYLENGPVQPVDLMAELEESLSNARGEATPSE